MRLNRHTIIRWTALTLVLAVTAAGLWWNTQGTTEAADFRSELDYGSAVEARTGEIDVDGSNGQEYEPQEAQDEDYDPEANLPYMFAVFIITWAVFFGYAFIMSRRQNEMRDEIESLQRSLAERDGPEEPS